MTNLMAPHTPTWLHNSHSCGNVLEDIELTRPENSRSMHFKEIYRANSLVLSYELFPPKTDKGMDSLAENVERLLTFHPHFITCTYGAGGSTRDKTLTTLARVQDLTHLPVASHLTCVGSTADDLRDYLQRAADQGIDNIVAIRGDAPEGQDKFTAVEGGFAYGSDLIAFIRKEFSQFGIAAGGYPEVHPEATSPQADLDHLKEKVDNGADLIITQLFYDNDLFYRYRDNCVKTGINVPIVPGILPVTSFKQIKRITDLSGAFLPKSFSSALEKCGDDTDAQFEVGVTQASEQTADLVAQGVSGIHFYVLNQSRATSRVLETVKLSTKAE